MEIPPLPLLLPLVLASTMLPPCSSSPPSQCKFDYTALALLSCQETAPAAPTKSCCDTLLYAVDTWPLSNLYKGACCLCLYMVDRKPDFDLAGSYVACNGKDARAVLAWMATNPLSCDGQYNLDKPLSPPPPCSPAAAGGGSSGGGDGARKQQARLGPGAIGGIVFAAVGGAGLLGWCIYRTFCSTAAKAHKSPDPTTRGTDSRQEGLEMPHLSSARRSTSVLLDY